VLILDRNPSKSMPEIARGAVMNVEVLEDQQFTNCLKMAEL
jgi:hypothetical protein